MSGARLKDNGYRKYTDIFQTSKEIWKLTSVGSSSSSLLVGTLLTCTTSDGLDPINKTLHPLIREDSDIFMESVNLPLYISFCSDSGTPVDF